MDGRNKEDKQADLKRRPITIVNTTDGVFSNDSRKNIRSYSQAWARRQRKKEEKLQASALTRSLPQRPLATCRADLAGPPLQTIRNSISTSNQDNSCLLSPSSSEIEELSTHEERQLSFGRGEHIFLDDRASQDDSAGLSEDATVLGISAALLSALLTPPTSPR